MVNLQKIFERTGLRSGLIIGTRIAEEFLLTEDEKKRVESIAKVLFALPFEFKYGFVEIEDNLKLGVVRVESDSFVVFPTRHENVGELCRELAGGLIE